METKRTMTVDTEMFEVGDVLAFSLNDGEKVQAMAVEETPAGMLFCMVDCLTKEYPMFEDIDEVKESEISYMNSDLRKALNGEIFARFPEEIKSRMVAVNAEGAPYTAHFDAGCGMAVDLITGEKHDFGGGSELPPYSVQYWKMER